MADLFDFLHIKGRTSGSSNELSFDVLDAKSGGKSPAKKSGKNKTVGKELSFDVLKNESQKIELNETKTGKGRHGRNRRLGSINARGLSNVSSGDTFFSASDISEVKRRKRRRLKSTLMIATVSSVLALGLLAAIFFIGMRIYNEHTDFNTRFSSIISSLSTIDKELVEIDDVMQKTQLFIESGSEDALNTLVSDIGFSALKTEEKSKNRNLDKSKMLKNIEKAQTDCSFLLKDIEETLGIAQDNNKKVAIQQAKASVEKRINVFSSAKNILEKLEEIYLATNEGKSFWSAVLKADEEARDSSEKAKIAKDESATLEAKDLTESAKNSFSDALYEVNSLEQGNNKLSLEAEKNYIEQRIVALEAAIKTLEALLDNNKDLAIESNNNYNSADKEATMLAEKLPRSQTEKVWQAYKQDLEEEKNEYDNNREAVAIADSGLRQYIN